MENNFAEELHKALLPLLLDEGALAEIGAKLGKELSVSKILDWRRGISYPGSTARGMPWAAIEAAALAYKTFSSPQPQSVLEYGVPQDLLAAHGEALKTTWLWGSGAYHLLKLDLPVSDNSAVHGTIWRFWEKVQMVSPLLAPLSKSQPSWVVHSSRLEKDDASAASWDVDKPTILTPETDRGESRIFRDKGRVDFTHEVYSGRPPVNCGYSYGIQGPFLRCRSEKRDFDFFSGANAIVVRRSYILVSLPNEFFKITPLNADEIRANSFATLPSLLPQQYVKRVFSEAKARLRTQEPLEMRSVHQQDGDADSRPDPESLFLTWGRWLRLQLGRYESGVFHLFDKDGSPAIPDAIPFPDELKPALESMSEEGRTVFIAITDLPNPLCYQSIFWPLPLAPLPVMASQSVAEEANRHPLG